MPTMIAVAVLGVVAGALGLYCDPLASLPPAPGLMGWLVSGVSLASRAIAGATLAGGVVMLWLAATRPAPAGTEF